MIQFKAVSRLHNEATMKHAHYPSVETLMSRRVLGSENDVKTHVLMWRFNVSRKQWEAVCERDDVIHICPGVDEDIEFRQGRYIEQC